MAITSPPPPELDRRGVVTGLAFGVPVAVATGAVLSLWRSAFNSTNAALVLMVVVVAGAALGGRTAGVITALAAVLSFDFFHTRPYLSLSIDSRDDVETTVLLLIAGMFVGTIAAAGRTAQRRGATARSDIRRIHRVAEAAAAGRPSADVIAIARDELIQLLTLAECRFEALPFDDDIHLPHLGRNGSIELQRVMRSAHTADGRGGFELPEGGVEIAVLARGQQVGRFVLVPTPGVGTSLEDRVVAVAIADQTAALWAPPGSTLQSANRPSNQEGPLNG